MMGKQGYFILGTIEMHISEIQYISLIRLSCQYIDSRFNIKNNVTTPSNYVNSL